MSNICPVCHHDDRIQKVSALHSEGISSGSYYDPVLEYQRNIHSQTELSKKLSPPPRPADTAANTRAYWWVWGGVIFVLGIIVLPSYGGQTIGILAIAASLIFFIIGLGISALQAPESKAKIAQWEAVMAVWNRLYYCARDDIVFDPNTGKCCSPEAWRSLA